MGLDISAYSRITCLEVLDDTEGWEDKHDTDQTIYVYPQEQDHIVRMPPIVERGVYRIADSESLSFRAGSYSGYNIWRDELSQMALGVSAKVVWSNTERYKDAPFYELINFSDCEGVIGSEAAARLAKAFADHQTKAKDTGNDYFIEKYAQWRRAFELAAADGIVIFG